jgi:hypothetical protein
MILALRIAAQPLFSKSKFTLSVSFRRACTAHVRWLAEGSQMSWSRRGAHLLLQVRPRVLNEEFREKFDE